ncbi:MAG: hypothetical protein WBP11_10060 [Dokdonella sp.]
MRISAVTAQVTFTRGAAPFHPPMTTSFRRFERMGLHDSRYSIATEESS